MEEFCVQAYQDKKGFFINVKKNGAKENEVLHKCDQMQLNSFPA